MDSPLRSKAEAISQFRDRLIEILNSEHEDQSPSKSYSNSNNNNISAPCEWNKHDSNSYDKFMMDRIQTDDNLVLRYLKSKGNVIEDAVKSFHRLLKLWREWGINDLNFTYVPKVAWELRAISAPGKDVNGNMVLVGRAKHHVPLIAPAIRAFMAYALREFVYNWPGEEVFPCTIIYDMQGFGIENMPKDLTMLWLTLDLYECMPAKFERLIIHGLPWICSSFVKGCILMAPAEYRKFVHFTTNKTIHQYVTADNLPDFIANGCSTKNYLPVPPDGDLISLEKALNLYVSDSKKHPYALKLIKKFLEREGLPADYIPTIGTQ